MDKIRAACYVRTSTDLEEQEGSFKLQCDYFTKLILSNPRLEFVDCYGDLGCSGRDTRGRPEFTRMMQDCEEHKINVIYTKSVSRFARSITDLAETVAHLRELGVYVYFERENINTRHRGSELLLNVIGIIAQEESRSFGENVRLGLQDRMSTGHPVGKVPYGYRRINRNADWSICEEEASRIRLAFRLAAEGIRYPYIRQALDQLEAEDNTGISWSRDRLRRTLTNVVYKGDVLTGKVYRINGKVKINRGEHPSFYLEGHHEPIVSPEVFDRVQYLMDAGLLSVKRRNFTPDQISFINDSRWAEKQDKLENRIAGMIQIEGGSHVTSTELR